MKMNPFVFAEKAIEAPIMPLIPEKSYFKFPAIQHMRMKPVDN